MNNSPALSNTMGSRHNYWRQIFIAITSVAACFIYFDAIGPSWQYFDTYYWSRPANISDHSLYVNYARYQSISELAIADNNFGVSWFFLSIADPYDEIQLFIVNIAFMLIAFYFYCKICLAFSMGASAYWAWLLNAFILYFALLINKDMATIAVILAVSWFALQRRFGIIILMIPFVFVLRQQLFLFLAFLLFLELPVLGGKYKSKVAVVLVAGSVAGIIALQTFQFMALESLGEGLTGQITAFFLDEAWLAPLGVPLRILLYIYDYASSIVPFYKGQIDAIKALRIPSIIFFVAITPSFIRALRDTGRRTDFEHYRPLFSVTIAFVSALLINPQINARYLTCLVPLLILLVLIVIHKPMYQRSLRKLPIRPNGLAANRLGR